MGESISEATIISWKKKVGDPVKEDDIVVEVATDKVDNEVPSEASGILVKQFFNEKDTIKVGDTYAIVETDSKGTPTHVSSDINTENKEASTINSSKKEDTFIKPTQEKLEDKPTESKPIDTPLEKEFSKVIPSNSTESVRFFYSPLIRSIMTQENIDPSELQHIKGTGKNNRLTKEDLLKYLKQRNDSSTEPRIINPENPATKTINMELSEGDQVVEMDRVRKLIAHHMVDSLKTSAHVQSIVEADVTNMVKWRDLVKAKFHQETGVKLTFTPILIEAIVRILRDFPIMNSHISGEKIIMRKNINIGMATALENNNLIVPVIKNAETLNIVGLAKEVTRLSERARNNKLTHSDTTEGTYTVSNIGSFGTMIGTPIINQPQVGIMALGVIQKVPTVLESPQGDFIGIRYRMFLSHSYDHRIVDGAVGGLFVKKVAEYIENWDVNRTF
ncbi:dihydrolipoamide acetyltransferase component of pyruvate dehydrogenase complex [Elysia marginata]|uniref:Dihydrolipoamide acetyltransferase component of pyruvate dehydrogenase complex n=1 Tax=Elysia marginata TaxID=1093978 RepID=A0AAV4F0Q9_9GAST|nr:dihydrolipoamide acetyltransferase component of pyruvate dehydrogenase complex [Elysia marginata]